jgi:hypothetical protein
MSTETELNKINLRLVEIARDLQRIADALEAHQPLPLTVLPSTTMTGSTLAEWIADPPDTKSNGGDDARP